MSFEVLESGELMAIDGLALLPYAICSQFMPKVGEKSQTFWISTYNTASFMEISGFFYLLHGVQLIVTLKDQVLFFTIFKIDMKPPT